MIILGVDPGITCGVALIDLTPELLQVKVLSLREPNFQDMLYCFDELLEKHPIERVVYENWVHYTEARNKNTTETAIGCGKVLGWAHCKGLAQACRAIPPGSYHSMERRYSKEVAPYRSHSGAALKHILFDVYFNLKYTKIKIVQGN